MIQRVPAGAQGGGGQAWSFSRPRRPDRDARGRFKCAAYGARGGDIRHVIVAGDVVVRDGRPTRFDLDEVHASIAEQVQRRAGTADVPPDVTATVERLQAVRAALATREGRPVT